DGVPLRGQGRIALTRLPVQLEATRFIAEEGADAPSSNLPTVLYPQERVLLSGSPLRGDWINVWPPA
ncbi:MAG TPA: hypothetical protein VIM58_10250, partial [Candidatus Methylacidiphilales bacterium]